MSSKKRPLMLTWENANTMAEHDYLDYKIIFKNGDGRFSFYFTNTIINHAV